MGGVRLRTAIAAAVVVAVAGLLAAFGFVRVTESILTHNVDSSARQRAAEVTAGLRDDEASDVIETMSGDMTLVQVLDSAGNVVASSFPVGSKPPLASSGVAVGHSARSTRPWPESDDSPYRIWEVGVQTQAGPQTVVVAQSLQPVRDNTGAQTRALAAGMPVLVLVVGLATFVFVGRSLRPVEAIRRRVASITAQDLHARVPLPRGRDEVAALARTMNAMLDRLESAAIAQRRFVADAGHELRSPLATIQVGLDYLAARATTGTGLAQVTLLRGEAERLGTLVADLLLLARSDEDGLALRHRELDLDDLVLAERDRFTARFPAVDLRVRLEPVRLFGDAARLRRALRNLLDNAARHATSAVTVSVWADDRAHLVVADDGSGIDPGDRERVFDRFVRLDDSRARQDGGSGLGLPITREIVDGHGGEVRIDDGDGAVFHVLLPLTKADADHPPLAANR
ncbi:sensor histidine kinase [Paractinoplanes globisporus]|uniref:histidine kinase n=1 Tax=Paractinoplanes globisporus TaxID=113565 RepID=A0ABW6WCM0_9ACTN|nr:HAMP domain-containing sensor histidine kinase [Actinoplanes globisporus]